MVPHEEVCKVRSIKVHEVKALRVSAKWPVAFLTGVILSCVTGWLPSEALARRHAAPETFATHRDMMGVVALSSLPVPAKDVHRRILSGGPFRYGKDGTVFGNRERVLPRQSRGYYREYTVPTPGQRDRGARRIVCGGKDERQPETCFYTQDHYQNFQQIDPRR
jgi:ribonuclease T1